MARRRKRAFGGLVQVGAIWYARWTERGKERKKAIGGSRDLAERFLARKATELDRERALGIRAVEKARFEDLMARYEVLFASLKAPLTVKREAVYLRGKVLPAFREMWIDEIRREDLEKFLTKRVHDDGIGAATRNRLLSILSAFFKKAVALNHARENPCKGIQRTQEALREPPFLDLEAQEKVIATAPEPLRQAVTVALDTGIRAGELAQLEWRDVDFKGRTFTVRVSKNKRPRIVPFTRRGEVALRAMAARRPEGVRVPDFVFADLRTVRDPGAPGLSNVAVWQWRRTREAAGFADLRWHDLRHVFATTAARAGVPLGDLRQILGHSSLTMVLRYARHAPANSGDLARDRLEAYLGGNAASRAAQ